MEGYGGGKLHGMFQGCDAGHVPFGCSACGNLMHIIFVRNEFPSELDSWGCGGL